MERALTLKTLTPPSTSKRAEKSALSAFFSGRTRFSLLIPFDVFVQTLGGRANVALRVGRFNSTEATIMWIMAGSDLKILILSLGNMCA
jgi:hypothetical protein